MKTLSELIAQVKDHGKAGRCFCIRCSYAAPVLAEVVEKMKERLGPCMCEYERGCDYCETMAELDAMVARQKL